MLPGDEQGGIHSQFLPGTRGDVPAQIWDWHHAAGWGQSRGSLTAPHPSFPPRNSLPGYPGAPPQALGRAEDAVPDLTSLVPQAPKALQRSIPSTAGSWSSHLLGSQIKWPLRNFQTLLVRAALSNYTANRTFLLWSLARMPGNPQKTLLVPARINGSSKYILEAERERSGFLFCLESFVLCPLPPPLLMPSKHKDSRDSDLWKPH